MLASVLFLLALKNNVVEHLLELLVGRVDEDLLETVALHVFESEDVQDADKLRLLARTIESHVGPVDEPVEETGVDGLGQGVAEVGRLVGLVVRDDPLAAAELADSNAERFSQGGGIDAQQLPDPLEGRVRPGRDGRAIVTRPFEFYVADPVDAGRHGEDVRLVVLPDAERRESAEHGPELLRVVHAVHVFAAALVGVAVGRGR